MTNALSATVTILTTPGKFCGMYSVRWHARALHKKISARRVFTVLGAISDGLRLLVLLLLPTRRRNSAFSIPNVCVAAPNFPYR